MLIVLRRFLMSSSVGWSWYPEGRGTPAVPRAVDQCWPDSEGRSPVQLVWSPTPGQPGHHLRSQPQSECYLGCRVAQFLGWKVGIEVVSLSAFHVEIVESWISLLRREISSVTRGHLYSVNCVGLTKILIMYLLIIKHSTKVWDIKFLDLLPYYQFDDMTESKLESWLFVSFR